MVPSLAIALLLAAAPRVAVMPIAAGEAISEKAAASLTETLAGELRQQSGAPVVTSRDLTSLLSLEKQKQALGCTSDACLAEIAGAAGADRLVAGDVARLGESLVVQLRLLDVRKATVLSHSNRRLKKGTFDDLLDALPEMVGELLRGVPAAVEAAPPPPRAAATAPAAAAATPARPPAASPAAATPAPVPAGQWTRVAPIDPPRHGVALAAVGGKLYAFGGWTPAGSVAVAQVYDPATGAWRSLPPMPTARNECQIAVLDGRIYVIGGWSGVIGSVRTETVVEAFDPATGQWSTRAPLPAPHPGAVAVAADGRIYLLCGGNDSTLAYDPKADRWERRAVLPSGRHMRAAGGLVGGKIYVVGGDSRGSVDVYDPVADRWNAPAAPRAALSVNPRRWPAGASLGSRICVLGGADQEDADVTRQKVRFFDAVECYDPQADRVSPLLPLPGGRWAAAAASLGDALYVVGGFGPDGPVSWVDVLRP